MPCAGYAVVFAGCGGLSHDAPSLTCKSNCGGEGGYRRTAAAGASGLVGEGGASGSGVSAGQAGFAGAGGAPICTGGEAPLLCDGKCVDSYQDDTNCGTCGHVCVPPAACAFGSCRP